VPVGSASTRINRDSTPQTAVSTSGAFKSKVMDMDERFPCTFAKLGTYPLLLKSGVKFDVFV